MNNPVYLKLVEEVHTDVTREADPSDEWDVDDISESHTLLHLKVVDKEDYFDFISPNPKAKQLYMVYVTYSTGDSFHHEDGKICLIDVYNNEGDAEYVMTMLLKDYKENPESFGALTITLPSGIIKTIGVSTWKGYFERLQNVDYKLLEVIE